MQLQCTHQEDQGQNSFSGVYGLFDDYDAAVRLIEEDGYTLKYDDVWYKEDYQEHTMELIVVELTKLDK